MQNNKENILEVHNICYKYPENKNIKGKVCIISPNKEKGFNCGYSLFIPETCEKNTILLVHCCNTGGFGVKDEKLDESRIAIHLEEGIEAAKISTIYINQGMIYGYDLKMPVLTPLIPRVRGYYTQSLGSRIFKNDISFLIKDNNGRASKDKLSETEINNIREQCKDLHLQLVNMIKDSKRIILELGINIDDKVIIEGYSASSKFANRFTALHPEIIKACIGGGTSGLNILPIKELNGEVLNYPIGVANIKNFNIEAFKSIPQYYYIGNEDYNDPAQINKDNSPVFKENYTTDEVIKIKTILGKEPQERFDNIKRIYDSLNVNAIFKRFNGDHTSIMKLKDNNGNFIVNESVEEFIKKIK